MPAPPPQWPRAGQAPGAGQELPGGGQEQEQEQGGRRVTPGAGGQEQEEEGAGQEGHLEQEPPAGAEYLSQEKEQLALLPPCPLLPEGPPCPRPLLLDAPTQLPGLHRYGRGNLLPQPSALLQHPADLGGPGQDPGGQPWLTLPPYSQPWREQLGLEDHSHTEDRPHPGPQPRQQSQLTQESRLAPR